jgi:outer membrane protein OmpA-like peptidoglycan-associated protein
MVALVGCVRPVLSIGELPREVNCIAVAPFDVRFDAASTDELLSEFLALDLTRMGARGILSPRELRQIFRQVRDRLPPAIDPYWARTIGKRLGVDGVIFGSISRIPVSRDPRTGHEQIQLVLDVYLLEVRSGEIRWAYGAREMTETDGLVPMMNRHSELMGASLVGKHQGVFGEYGCWKAPQAAPQVAPAQQTTPVPHPALTAEQQSVLDAVAKLPGYFLQASVFEGRTAQLTKEAVPALRAVSTALLSDKAPRRVQISGHLDATLRPAEDLQLSKLRAEAVRKYLIDMGVPARRLEAVGHGGTQPQVPNLNERSRILNRGTVLLSIDPAPSR